MAIKEIGAMDSDGETEGKEVTEADLTKVSSGSERGVWTNQKRVPISLPITCHVPQKIVIVMRSIEHLMIHSGMGALEFGIFVSGNFNDEGRLVLSEEFYVPQQKVSGATIDFEEEPPEAKFNGVIHRHPTGCKGFSGTDSRYINSNFDFSLLYEGNELILGITNLDVNGVRIQVPVRIDVMYPIFELSEENTLSKIKRHETLMKSSSNESNDNPLFGDRHDFRRLLRQQNDVDDNELGLGAIDGEDIDDIKSLADEENEQIYQCKKCGEVQYIDVTGFPHCCESCEEILDEDSFDLITDVTELDEDTQGKVFLKMQEKKE